jgi:hypothetical protein
MRIWSRRPGFGWVDEGLSAHFAGKWGKLDKDNLLQGRAIGPDGRPVRYATMQIRQKREPGMLGIAAPDVGTDEQGRYYYDKMEWPYSVGVLWRQPLPQLFGYRWQVIYGAKYYKHGQPQTVDYRFDPFPTGTAGLDIQVMGNDARPMKEFTLDVRGPVGLEGPEKATFGYRLVVASPTGTFELPGLPAGKCIVRVMDLSNTVDGERVYWVTLEPGKICRIRPKVYHGRILTEDGQPTPVTVSLDFLLPTGAIERRAISACADPEGYFRISLTDEQVESIRRNKAKLSIAAGGKAGRSFTLSRRRRKPTRLGEFPMEKLSLDRAKAGVVEVPNFIENEPVRKADDKSF